MSGNGGKYGYLSNYVLDSGHSAALCSRFVAFVNYIRRKICNFAQSNLIWERDSISDRLFLPSISKVKKDDNENIDTRVIRGQELSGLFRIDSGR